MFKPKIISYTILFTSLFTILSGCSVGESKKDSGEVDSSDFVVEEGLSSDPLFRSTWRVPASDKTITLPLVSGGYTYNFTVDWGDGQSSEITAHDDLDKKHTYENEGDYNLVIEGTLEAWSFNNAGDKDKIRSVENFGDLGYKDLSGAFQGCINLGVFKGGVTSGVFKMKSMFQDATSANPDVSKWDVSKVENMQLMFRNAVNANPDVSKWDVSSVINMISVFDNATKANPNVSKWNVSRGYNMSYMFRNAVNANPDMSKWTVTNIYSMISMFNNSGLSTENYDAFLINLATNNASVMDVRLGVGVTKLSSDEAKTAKDRLIGRGWIITDGGDATP